MARLIRPDRISIANLWSRYGRNRCQFCDGLIGHLDLDFEVEADFPAGRKVLHFHGLCYDQWLAEAASVRP